MPAILHGISGEKLFSAFLPLFCLWFVYQETDDAQRFSGGKISGTVSPERILFQIGVLLRLSHRRTELYRHSRSDSFALTEFYDMFYPQGVGKRVCLAER